MWQFLLVLLSNDMPSGKYDANSPSLIEIGEMGQSWNQLRLSYELLFRRQSAAITLHTLTLSISQAGMSKAGKDTNNKKAKT